MSEALQIRVGGWSRLSALAGEVRRAVFIVEQGIPESEEWDDIDALAVHWVALLDGEAVGCARLTREGKIGRMAVLAGHRGRGIGRQLLQACIDYAAERQFPEVTLSAQQHALSFYEKQGFKPVGDPHEEVGIPHQWMHRSLQEGPAGEPLSDYLNRVRALLDSLPATWVTGTVSELRRHNSGHVYLTLVQTADDGEVSAKCRAVIWRGQAAAIEARFRQATGLSLDNNQDVMLQVRAQSHPVHGFSLVVEDIHPEFTVGRLAARLERIRRQLEAEGIYRRNRELGLPSDYFRVAVLSPSQAAGLGDFRSRADQLAALGLIEFTYVSAVFQGPQTVTSVCAGLQSIVSAHAQQPFDALVIIRGGGSEWDLACLNEYEIARLVCLMPMPVLCGIGHERDRTLIDEIVSRSLPTPSMVIDFIESTVMTRLQRVVVNMRDIRRLALQKLQRAADASDVWVQGVADMARGRCESAALQMDGLHARLRDAAWQALARATESGQQQVRETVSNARQQMSDASQAVERQHLRVAERARREVAVRQQALAQLRNDVVPQAALQRIETAGLRLESLADFVRSQDPVQVLERGYAIVMDEQGNAVTDAAAAVARSQLNIRMRDGHLLASPVQEKQKKEDR